MSKKKKGGRPPRPATYAYRQHPRIPKQLEALEANEIEELKSLRSKLEITPESAGTKNHNLRSPIHRYRAFYFGNRNLCRAIIRISDKEGVVRLVYIDKHKDTRARDVYTEAENLEKKSSLDMPDENNRTD